MKINRCGFFIGEFKHSLTDKNRLALPKRIRIEIESDEVVLSYGFEPCINGFDKKQWETIAKEQLTNQIKEDQSRRLRREVFASALIIEIDRQGRVVLPDSLLEWAELKGKVGEELIVIGAGDHFEIWSQQNWGLYVKSLRPKNEWKN